ncbi:MAG: type III pantothenate kinase [Muribaculaceae bacterium]|nr:type III pantothenate kinase [Muribaculaceae bacterium]
MAFFIGAQLVATNRFDRTSTAMLERMFSNYKPDTVTLCNVTEGDTEIDNIVNNRCRRVLRLSHTTPLPIALGYLTPETLGRDRIATAVGAWTVAQRLAPGSDMLIIDAGTAVTYDLVTGAGRFVGGNISPGLEMRFKALHEHTGNLPLVSSNGAMPVVGYDTDTAIRSGVALGLLGEIRSHIADIRLSHPNLLVFVTGGDGKFLRNNLKSDFIYLENLLAEGLNRIFLYNEQRNENQ